MCWACCISTRLLGFVFLPELPRVSLAWGFRCPLHPAPSPNFCPPSISLHLALAKWSLHLSWDKEDLTSDNSPHPSYLTHEFGLQLPKSASQWINWLLLIHIFSSGYGCNIRILGPFLIDTEDTDAKWHLLQAVCCFIKRSWIHSVILWPTGASFYLIQGRLPSHYMGDNVVEPLVSVWRKQRTRYFNLPLIACEFIWRGGMSSTRLE